MDVINEIKGDTYKKLIDYVFENCNQFSLYFWYPHTYGMLENDVQKIMLEYSNITDEVVPEIVDKINHSEFMKKFFKSHKKDYICQKEREKILHMLQKYKVGKKYSIFEWSSYSKKGIRGVTYFFKIDKELKQFFLEKNNIYDWVYWNNSMEDLCFYIDDFCFLTSVAHEKMLAINCRNEEEYEYLKSIGIEFYEKEFVKTNDVFIS